MNYVTVSWYFVDCCVPTEYIICLVHLGPILLTKRTYVFFCDLSLINIFEN